jgi:hypothetical protein
MSLSFESRASSLEPEAVVNHGSLVARSSLLVARSCEVTK